MKKSKRTRARILGAFSASVLVLFFISFFPAMGFGEDIPGQCDPPPYSEGPSAFSWTQATGETTWHKDVNSGCSYSDHNITLDIDAEPADIADAHIKMTNYDIDYQSTDCSGGPEVDYLYVNGNYVGQLQGANNSWSTNTFAIPSAYLVKGSNAIRVDTDATGTGCWCVGVGYVEVTGKVGFQVTDYTPAADQKNVKWDAADITIDFSNELKTASLTSATIILDYRDQGGNWVSVNTNITTPSAKQAKVTPSAALKDGIRYRMRVLNGPSGVLDINDNELETEATWYFWTMVDLDGETAQLVPPNTTKDKMQITWFNVSRNKDLIPIKWVVNRIYLLWEPKADVFDADEVTEFTADLTLAVNGTPTTLSDRTIKRYDKYSENEKRMAQNTVNFDRLGSSGAQEAYKLTVEPKPQSGTAHTFTQNATATLKASSPSLSYNFWACSMAGWFNGPVAAELTAAKTELTAGKTYMSHLYPIVGCNQEDKGTVVSGAGGFNMEYVETKNSAWWGDTVRFVKDLTTHVETEEIRQVYRHLGTLKPAAHKFIIGLVPDDALPGANGVSVGSVILLAQGNFNASTVAHEVGHQYDIATVTGAGCTNEHNNDGRTIEGFNVYSMKNKSFTEGNSDYVAANHNDCNGTAYKTGVLPLMNKWGVDTKIRWLRPENYDQLVTKLLAASVSTQELAALTGEYLVITGSTDENGNLEIVDPLYNVTLPHIGLPTGSGFTATLYSEEGGAGTALVTYDFGTDVLHIDGVSRNEEFDSRTFAFNIPFDDGAQSLVLSGPDPAYNITINKSDNGAAAPTATFTSVADGDVLSGDVALTWTGSDDGGSSIYYRLEFSPDSISWIPVSGQIINALSYTLDTTLLPSGTGQKLALIASDGFNTARTEINVTVDNNLAVQSTYPQDGATDVSLDPVISVDFVSALDSGTVTANTVQLLQNGTAVPGTVAYSAATHTVTFNPDSSLAANTTYTVVLSGSLITDTNTPANTLGQDYQFSFTTETPSLNPQVERVSPAQGLRDIPTNAIIQATFSEAIDSLTLTATTFYLEDAGGTSIPGTITYNSDLKAAVLVPDTPLTSDATYTATLTTGIQDTQGLGLEAPYTWSFETGSQPGTGVRVIGVLSDAATDTDGNGLYDVLTITVQVEITTPGSYDINAQLKDQNGEDLNWNSAQAYYSQAGVYTIDVEFQGRDIGNNAVDGPYTVTNVYAYNTGDSSIYSSLSSAYLTQAYSGASFEAVLTLSLEDIAIAAESGLNDNVVNLESRATHATYDVSSLTYSIAGNSNTSVDVKIDSGHNLDIEPVAGFTGYTDVTIQVKDSDNVQLSRTIRVYVLSQFNFDSPGFHLISLPVNPSSPAVGDVLAPIAGKYNLLWTYDNGQWISYVPGAGSNQLTQLSAGIGYWIDIKEACQLRVMGRNSSGTASAITNSWNLLGYNAGIPQAPGTALSSIAGKYISAWVYINGQWQVYVPNNPAVTTMTVMEPGYGYWINAISPGTWVME